MMRDSQSQPRPSQANLRDPRSPWPRRPVSPRLKTLRQLRRQQKQRVRLLLIPLAVGLFAVAIALPVQFLRRNPSLDTPPSRDRLSEYLTSEPQRTRHRDNPFIENNLRDRPPEVRALLDTIAFAEGTHDDLGYRTLFTFDTFRSYRDHPRRVRCASHHGYRLCSDAAGRYQMISSTFDSVAKRLQLDDFSPKSQDLAAVELIRWRGGLSKIERGDFDGAIAAIRREWASLPDSGYGQPQSSREELRTIYQQRLNYYQDAQDRPSR
ncbi:MAG: glycoside hydrolase family 104 protein [Sodalinema sp.]|uniref:glycoside hydrolase family 24 protein n=1 Tax=Sodalinema sp. TaxID=3080550 RepID=UPI00120C36BF|nr:MAG: hypothetical protein EYR95_06330 [Phormidium sp. SL48-SHIP]